MKCSSRLAEKKKRRRSTLTKKCRANLLEQKSAEPTSSRRQRAQQAYLFRKMKTEQQSIEPTISSRPSRPRAERFNWKISLDRRSTSTLQEDIDHGNNKCYGSSSTSDHTSRRFNKEPEMQTDMQEAEPLPKEEEPRNLASLSKKCRNNHFKMTR